MELIDKLKENLVIEESWDKNSWWASDCEKDRFDLYHRFKGTPPTNPPDAEKQVIFATGKLLELSIVDRLRSMGLVVETDEQERIEIEREGITISGRMDCTILENGKPVIVEIKSFYGSVQSYELSNGKPRTSYLKQLAIYMDAKSVPKGILFYMDRGTGQMYQFNLIRGAGLMFSCVSANKDGRDVVTQFDLDEDYKRFAQIWNDYIIPDKEPDSDFTYKIPPAQVDWHSLPANQISKARNNQKVIGSGWQVAYSPFKDLIVAKEAKKYGRTFEDYIGYNSEELAEIKELTTGYTTWKK